MRMRWGLVFVLGVPALALAAACGDSKPAVTPTPTPTATATATPSPFATSSPTPAATPAPSPTPAVVVGYRKGTRTGELLVDRVIALIEVHDWDALAGLVQFTTYPCEAPKPVQPQPRLCRDGLNPDDPMTGFWVTDVEGGFAPPDRGRIAKLFEMTLADAGLDAVYMYSSAEREADAGRLGALFDVVFVRGAHGRLSYPNLDLTATGIVHLDSEFASMPYESWLDESAPGWVLRRAQ